MNIKEAINILENFKDGKTSCQYPIDVKEAIGVVILESKKEIDFNKLRDEFFKECTENRYTDDFPSLRTGLYVSLAPHDLFEWFKNKLNG